jgi:hypothetical protein
VRDLNPGLFEYKAGVLRTQPRRFFVGLGKNDFKKVAAFMAVTTLVW